MLIKFLQKKEDNVKQTDKYSKLLSRPTISRKDLKTIPSLKKFLKSNEMNDIIFEQAEIEIKYSGYIDKEKRNAEKLKRLENIKILEISITTT